jgi:hypothetical protein
VVFPLALIERAQVLSATGLANTSFDVDPFAVSRPQQYTNPS